MNKNNANNLEEVEEIIGHFLLNFKKTHNPMGYFTSIYKLTTLKVKGVCKNCDQLEKIKPGHTAEDHEKPEFKKYGEFHFEDTGRMRDMVVIFANRYFDALNAYTNQSKDSLNKVQVTGPWLAAFDHNDVLKQMCTTQHFFVSANAHINYDLGIAAAQVCIDRNISFEDFENDFDIMNEVLSSLYIQVNLSIGMIWGPMARMLGIFSRLIFNMESLIMKQFRNGAKDFTRELMKAQKAGDENRRNEIILKKEEDVTKLGAFLAHPSGDTILTKFTSWLVRCLLWGISLGERHSEGIRISLLENSEFIKTKDLNAYQTEK